jgi:hypothetical protein
MQLHVIAASSRKMELSHFTRLIVVEEKVAVMAT